MIINLLTIKISRISSIMNIKQKEEAINIFRKYSCIKLVYLFGSRADNSSGPLSDHDFALYCDSTDSAALFDVSCAVRNELASLLKTDMIDLVVLNTIQQPELAYFIISEGELLFEVEPFKILVEPKILNAYFDFYSLLTRYNLTKG